MTSDHRGPGCQFILFSFCVVCRRRSLQTANYALAPAFHKLYTEYFSTYHLSEATVSVSSKRWAEMVVSTFVICLSSHLSSRLSIFASVFAFVYLCGIYFRHLPDLLQSPVFSYAQRSVIYQYPVREETSTPEMRCFEKQNRCAGTVRYGVISSIRASAFCVSFSRAQ